MISKHSVGIQELRIALDSLKQLIIWVITTISAELAMLKHNTLHFTTETWLNSYIVRTALCQG